MENVECCDCGVLVDDELTTKFTTWDYDYQRGDDVYHFCPRCAYGVKHREMITDDEQHYEDVKSGRVERNYD